MLINNINVNNRQNNPPVLSKVGLRVLFMQDGQYFDPYEISAVSIFKESSTFSPSSILDSEELISSSVSSYILMNFHNPSPYPTDESFNVENYNGLGEDRIYKLGDGEYIVILDQVANQTGTVNLWGANQQIVNAVSTIGDYVDVWTVKMVAESKLETVFNYFTLTRGNFYTITEPVLFRTRNRLLSNSIVLGSKVDIKIATDLTVESALTEEVKNTIRDSVVRSASIEITKINSESNMPAKVVVSSFIDTANLTRITANDTIVFTWDTDLLKTHPEIFSGNLGSLKGMYAIQAKYNLFNERILTPLMYLTVE